LVRADDIEVQILPDVVYVENFAGNVAPVDRVFFHIVIRNTSAHPVEIQWARFDIAGAEGSLLSAQYSGAALMSQFDRAIDERRIAPTPRRTLVLQPDEQKAISDVFLDCPRGFIGETLIVEVAYTGDRERRSRQVTRPLSRARGFAGRLPFDGVWYVSSEHSFLDSHKRLFAEAFAYDFLQIGADGRSYQRAGSQNSDYYAYGKKVLASAAGTVVMARSDVAENVPGIPNTNTPYGNVVVIDHGGGHYAYYAHLKPFSVYVRPGAQVQAGDPIGEVGNSGDSLEPHLHFHVVNDPDPDKADGVPAVFEKWKAQAYGSRPVERELGALPRGEFVAP
ncbi:MAG TPA: M23 family metallopeptidase, partial [Terriglobia bacterium]|nr:M23 family metallopeptidase [Terriglobia bacterium]